MKNLPFWLAALSTFCLSAQKLTLGEVYDDAYYNYAPQILGENDTALFVADIDNGRDIILESYDKESLSRHYHKKIETGASFQYPSLRLIKDLFYSEGYFYYFTSLRDFHHAYSELYLHRVNAYTGEKERVDTVIHQVLDMSKVSPTSMRNNRLGDYYISSSENNKSTAVIFSFKNVKNHRIYEYVILYDKHMRIVKQKEFVRDNMAETLPHNVLVDDEGSMYYLRGGEFVLLDYYKDYEEWHEPLPNGGFASNGRPLVVEVRFKPNGNLALVAEYITTDAEDTEENKLKADRKEDDTQIEGFIYLELNSLNQEMEVFGLSDLPDNIYEEVKTYKHHKKNLNAEVNQEFGRFDLKFLDEGAILVSEVGPTREDLDRDQGMLMVSRFDGKGDLMWSHAIHKDQEVKRSEQAVSYGSMSDEDSFYLFFQDAPDNYINGEQVRKLETWEDNDEYIPVMVKFDKQTGEKTMSTHPELVVEDFTYQPRFSRQSKGNEPLYILLKDGGDYRLGSLSMDSGTVTVTKQVNN